ncbi:hypothetical protein CYG49_04235 [Candidatus Saccharibacteria bacterium]|nr:MAG: hypothetical protein CYG49_04235 [Candidatus Saccharibacteria bacterium]
MKTDSIVELLLEEELKAAIEDTAIAELIGRPGPLHESHAYHHILEAYYKTLAETDDETLALQAAREAV